MKDTTVDQVRAAAIEQFTVHGPSYAAAAVITDRAALDVLAELAGLSAASAPGTTVLDAACGPGIVSCHLAALGADVLGIDLTPAMLALAVERAVSLGVADRVRFVPGTMEELPAADATVDVAVSRYAVHHSADPAAVARELRRVVRPGGCVVLVDFAAADDPTAADAYDRAERLRDSSHVRNLTRAELMAIFAAAGLRLERTAGYALHADLDRVLAGSHGVDHPGVRRAFEASIGGHGLGVGARWADEPGGRIAFDYPIAGFRFRVP